jgi:hypothetical protein
MVLAVQVGVLADLLEADPEGAQWLRESLDATNELLQANDLPPHSEPETLARLDNRCSLDSYPYSFLHHLRRVYAHCTVDPSWVVTPLTKGEEASGDPIVEEQYRQMNSHLLCHSDAEGFYLPIDFSPILIDKTQRVPGGMVGSSLCLMEELTWVAPALGIRLDGQTLADSEAEAINASLEAQEGLFIERIVWLSLYEAARLSIEHGTAICFG